MGRQHLVSFSGGRLPGLCQAGLTEAASAHERRLNRRLYARQLGSHRKEGVLVPAELQVSIALLVVLHVHGLGVGAGQQARPHGLEARVGLSEVDASDGHAVPRLHTPRQLAPHLQVQATGGGPLRHLCVHSHSPHLVTALACVAATGLHHSIRC